MAVDVPERERPRQELAGAPGRAEAPANARPLPSGVGHSRPASAARPAGCGPGRRRYRKPTLVPTASIRSVPRWHISMMEASSVGLHIMWPSSVDTAAAGIEPGCGAPASHGRRCSSSACGGRCLGHNHSTMMSSCATTTPIVRKPQTASCFQSISRKSGKPLSAIAPPGSIAKSKPMAARAATAVTTLTMAYLPSRVALPDLTPPNNRPSHYYSESSCRQAIRAHSRVGVGVGHEWHHDGGSIPAPGSPQPSPSRPPSPGDGVPPQATRIPCAPWARWVRQPSLLTELPPAPARSVSPSPACRAGSRACGGCGAPGREGGRGRSRAASSR